MVKFNLTAKPLPSNFVGTPQQLLEAITERLNIVDDKATFVVSDTQPTTNVGPWFKNGKQLWVWDEALSTYKPLDLTEGLLPQVAIQTDSPDPSLYSYWYRILPGGQSGGLYYYLNGDWRKPNTDIGPGSITENKLADGAVATENFANGAVTSAKIAAPILLTKWEPGPAKFFAQAEGPAPRRLYSDLYSFTGGTKIEFFHGLGKVPVEAQVFFRANSTVDLPLVGRMYEGDVLPGSLQTYINIVWGFMVVSANSVTYQVLSSPAPTLAAHFDLYFSIVPR